MAITTALLNEMRKKTASGPFVFLIDIIDHGKSIIRRVTNSFENIDYSGETYQSFPLIVSIPPNSSAIGRQIQITFANFPDQAGLATLKADLQRAARADFRMINKERPADEILPKAVFFFSEKDFLRIDNIKASISFSRRILENKPFPFRRFNSEDHPLLYQTFEQAEYR